MEGKMTYRKNDSSRFFLQLKTSSFPTLEFIQSFTLKMHKAFWKSLDASPLSGQKIKYAET